MEASCRIQAIDALPLLADIAESVPATEPSRNEHVQESEDAALPVLIREMHAMLVQNACVASVSLEFAEVEAHQHLTL